MKQITKFFAIFLVVVSCLSRAVDGANEQGQVAAMNENLPPIVEEEEIIYPYSFMQP